ncbi:T9SS type A sorting domain-containing protein [Flavobacterium sp. XGLA_31]|uniref:T9SS type A sorting domain-containing protein n=1 Tax=Flavobacterium sp. XGLA_31 TaxID=3447666 RepID=UPI003F2B3AE7
MKRSTYTRYYRIIILFFLILWSSYSVAQVTTLLSPTFNNGGFEQGSTGWSFQNYSSGVNNWALGSIPTAGFSGANCAYISNSTGFPYSHQYTTTSNSYSKLYRDVVIPAGTINYSLRFKTLVQGKQSAAQLYVYLVPATEVLIPGSLPNGTALATYYLQGTGWTDKTLILDNTLLGNASSDVTKKLVFVWYNYSSSTGTQPPAAIDDVTLDNCSSPSAITAVSSFDHATLDWSSPDTSWNVRYKVPAATIWTTVNASTKPFVLSNLLESTVYTVQVQNATLPCSDWSTAITVTTGPVNNDCTNATLIEGQEDVNSLVMVVANYSGATLTGPTPTCNYTFPSNSGNLWFRFTANGTRYLLDSNSSSIKAELYAGTDCNNLVYQYCKSGLSYLDNLVPGTQYYLRMINTSIQDPQFSSNQMNFRLVKCPDAPANDLCENAFPWTGTAIPAQLVGANNEHPELPYNAFSSPTSVLGDVWFSFVATENYATIVSAPQFADLYSGSCAALTFMNTFNGSPKETSQLQIGQTYYVRVYSPNVTTSTPFTFNIIPRPSPVNDLCSAPATVVLDTDGETQFTSSGTAYATPSSGVPSTCTLSGTKDIWYQFTAGATAYLISSPYMTNTYSDSCGNFTQLGCGTTYTLSNLIVGQVYFIRVYTNQTITIREFYAADECNNSTVLIPAPNPNFTYSSTVNATAGALSTSCIANNKDVWFQFTATSTKNKITLLNAYATTVNEAVAITIYSGSCTALTEMGCYSFLNNNNLNVTLSSYFVGQTYYIKATRASGTYFGIKVIPIETQPNNEIATAIVFTPDEPGVCTQVSGSTAGADPSVSIPTPCNNTSSYADVWYSFVATVPSYKITYTTAGYHSFTIYKVTAPNTLTLFTCLTDNISGFEVGATYYIRVGSASETYSQTFSFCLSKIIDTPTNDECLNAITVPVASTMECTESITGSLAQATYDVTHPITAACIYGSLDKDIWYQFTATATKLLFNNTGNANKNIRYALMQGTCNALTCLYSSSLNGMQSSVLGPLTVGATYFLKISYVNDDGVSFCMSTAPVIENDLCQNATVLIPSSDLTCNTIRNYTCSEPSTALTVSGCTGSIPLYLYNASSNTNYGDAWYKFTATGTEHVLTFVTGGGYVQLFEGNCNGFSCHTPYNYANTSTNIKDFLFTQLTVGQTYYIRIIHSLYSHNLSYYDICLKTPTSVPSNDEYSNAMVLIPSADLDTCNPVSNTFNRATNSDSIQAPSCSNNSSPKDVWFQFTATSTHHQLQIHLSNPQALLLSFFTSLYSSVNGVINQEVSCFDPFDNVIPNLDVSLGGTDFNSNYYYTLMLQNYYNLTIGATYYIRMYPFVEQQYDYSIVMPYDVCLKTLPDIPANNDYTTATPLTVSPYDNIQYVSGYTTRAAYHVTEPYNNVTNPCAELGAFAYPAYQASNAWYKFTAQQTSEALHVINDADVLFPLTDYYNFQYYPLYAALYEYNNTVMETKQCYADTANNLIFNNLEVGKEYYLKMMYKNIMYQTDFEFQVSVANTTALGLNSSEHKSITLYPNPVADVVTLANPNHLELTGIRVYNIVGQLVLEQETTNNSDWKVDLSQLQKGAYVLKVKSSEGENNYNFLKK